MRLCDGPSDPAAWAAHTTVIIIDLLWVQSVSTQNSTASRVNYIALIGLWNIESMVIKIVHYRNPRAITETINLVEP